MSAALLGAAVVLVAGPQLEVHLELTEASTATLAWQDAHFRASVPRRRHRFGPFPWRAEISNWSLSGPWGTVSGQVPRRQRTVRVVVMGGNDPESGLLSLLSERLPEAELLVFLGAPEVLVPAGLQSGLTTRIWWPIRTRAVMKGLGVGAPPVVLRPDPPDELDRTAGLIVYGQAEGYQRSGRAVGTGGAVMSAEPLGARPHYVQLELRDGQWRGAAVSLAGRRFDVFESPALEVPRSVGDGLGLLPMTCLLFGLVGGLAMILWRPT